MAKVNLGRVVGYSAYELALQNGYVGTEEEWLASLHGKDGTVGFEELTPEQIEMLRGPQGPIGPEGPRGPAGPTFTITDADYDAIAAKAATRVDLAGYTTFVDLETRLDQFELNNYGVNRPENNHIIRKKEFDSSTGAFVNEDRAREIAEEVVDQKLGFISNAEEGVF